jgi:hypothetical protein
MNKNDIAFYTDEQFLKYWMKLMDELYPETVVKYKKLKIIEK